MMTADLYNRQRALNRAETAIVAVLCCLLLLMGCGGGSASPPKYAITDLGAESQILPSGITINDAEQVLISPDTPDKGSIAVLWQNGRSVEISPLPGYSNASAAGINIHGQVVGVSFKQGLSSHAFLWQDGSLTDLEALPNYPASDAAGINASAQVAGNVFDPARSSFSVSASHAALWEGRTANDLGTLGGSYSQASDINSAGQVVGWAETGPVDENRRPVRHAFLYHAGKMTDLGTFSGDTHSEAAAINDQGQVVGSSDRRALLWQNGRVFDLGTVPGFGARPRDINNAGQVIGSLYRIEQLEHAFLYTGGKMYDLNDLISPDSGWNVYYAGAINDRGQIVGWAIQDKQRNRAVLLTLQ